MPWKLFSFIFSAAVVLCLVGFNLDNKTDVSLVFIVFHDVPVFMTMFCAFCAGVIFTLPFTFGRRVSKRNITPAYSKQPKMPKKKREAITDVQTTEQKTDITYN